MSAQANLSSKVHPVLRAVARNLPRVAAAQGYQVRITSGYRSRATQAKLYSDYVKGISLYPAAPPGTSDHEKGLALDILSTNVEALVRDLTSIGLGWQGPADPIHFYIAAGTPRTNVQTVAKGTPAPKKKSVAKKVLSAASWVPGPVGLAATVLDFIF